jgi:hypothetical protein
MIQSARIGFFEGLLRQKHASRQLFPLTAPPVDHPFMVVNADDGRHSSRLLLILQQ